MGKTIERINNAFRYKDLLIELVKKDIKLKYRRSVLGYLWSVLNPLLVMIVMTIVFSTFFRFKIPNYPVYLLAGNLVFSYMQTTTNQAIYSILDNAPLLKKAYVPKYVFVFSRAVSNMVDMLLSLVALIVVMLITRNSFGFCNLLFPLVLIQLFVFTLGLSMFLAQACVFFRDVKYIYNAFITAWTYLTPLFYPVSMLPGKVHWLVTHLNPMWFYVAQFRAVVVDNTLPSMTLVIQGCVTALLMLAIGMWRFYRNQDRFILYI